MVDKAIKAVRAELAASIIIITLISLLSYALLIPWLGFYFDDWALGWVGQARGSAGLTAYVASDRPLSALPTIIDFTLLGNNRILWHVFIVCVRLIGSLLFLWVIRGLWPDKRRETTLAAILFACYPGFLQLSIPGMYQIYLLSLDLILVSLGATIYSFRASSKLSQILLIGLAIVSGLTAHLFIEAYLGLELVRVGIILTLRWDKNSHLTAAQIRRILPILSPYILMIIGYLVWRTFIFKGDRATTDLGNVLALYLKNPADILRIPFQLVASSLDSALFAWTTPIYEFLRQSLSSFSVVVLSLAISVAGCIAIFFWHKLSYPTANAVEEPSASPTSSWIRNICLLGVFATMGGLLPIVLSRFQVGLLDGGDRFTLPAMFGSCIVIFGLMFLIKRTSFRVLFVAVLVGCSMYVQVNAALQYVFHWQEQQAFYWQLSWRVPQLKPGTLLVADATNLHGYYINSDFYLFDNEIWDPVNMVFYPNDPKINVMAVILTQQNERMTEDGDLLTNSYRGLQYQFSFKNVLALNMPNNSQSCLRILDGNRGEIPSNADSTLRAISGYSRIDQINVNGSHLTPKPEIFGNEPPHTWCYYFEKAELARQQNDWAQVDALYSDVTSHQLVPSDPTEWEPFLEADVQARRYAEASKLIGAMSNNTDAQFAVRLNVCNLLHSYQSNPAYVQDKAALIALGTFCATG